MLACADNMLNEVILLKVIGPAFVVGVGDGITVGIGVFVAVGLGTLVGVGVGDTTGIVGVGVGEAALVGVTAPIFNGFLYTCTRPLFKSPI